MPSFPTNATTETETDDYENPWFDTDNGHYSASSGDEVEVEVETKASTSTPNKSIRPACHTRSQTTAGHPLRSLSKFASNGLPDVFERRASLDAHETRPSLRRRIINASRQSLEEDRHGRTQPTKGIKKPRKRDAEVIVHEVQAGDSLPGVALKYNISMATLRNANKLWTNDSIHLRQVLYIPTEAVASRSAKPTPPHSPEPHYNTSNLPLHSESNITAQHYSSTLRNSPTWDTNMSAQLSYAHTISAGAASNVRRVPLSELSFFPPPSRPSPPSRVHTPPTREASRYPTLPVLSSTSTYGLASYLNSTKDSLVTRLSVDSVRASSDLGEDPDDLELHVVGPNSRRRTTSSGAEGDRGVVRDYIGNSKGNVIELDTLMQEIPPDSPRKLKIIRTVQLQPSPTMIIPTRPPAEKSARKAVASMVTTGAS